MTAARRRVCAGLSVLSGICVVAAAPPPALAFNPIKPVCSIGGLVSGVVGKACTAVQRSGHLLDAGKKLVTGHVGAAVKSAFGTGTSGVASKATTALAFTAIVVAALSGAKFALHETEAVLNTTTAPHLQSTWFSAMYWRVAGIAAVLTLPFLFAASVQALLHSDISLLLRAAFGYLPLAMLAVGIAAPLTMLLLAASDQMAAIVSSAAGDASGRFLTRAALAIGAVSAFGSPFVALLIGLIAIAGGLVLWMELMIRAAAVYVVVLMLPLAFAALVWPARRIWAIRAVELLVALILSKFAIVAVLALGGAALGAGGSHGITGMLGGVVLLLMGAFAPWALLRLIPLAEIASGAAGSLSGAARSAGTAIQRGDVIAHDGDRWATRTAEMRREAEATDRESEDVAVEATHGSTSAPPDSSGVPNAASPDSADMPNAAPPDSNSSRNARPTPPPTNGAPTTPVPREPSFLSLPPDDDGPVQVLPLNETHPPEDGHP